MITKQDKRKLNQLTLVETVRLDCDIIRRVCINNEYFKRGSQEEYVQALEWFSDEPFSVESLYELAQYIIDHSELEDYVSTEDYVTSCAYALSKAAVRTYRLEAK